MSNLVLELDIQKKTLDLVGMIYNIKPNTLSDSELYIPAKIDELVKMINKFLPKLRSKKKKNLNDIYQEIKTRILIEKGMLKVLKKIREKNDFNETSNYIDYLYKENNKSSRNINGKSKI
jgi:hypothetical protein